MVSISHHIDSLKFLIICIKVWMKIQLEWKTKRCSISQTEHQQRIKVTFQINQIVLIVQNWHEAMEQANMIMSISEVKIEKEIRLNQRRGFWIRSRNMVLGGTIRPYCLRNHEKVAYKCRKLHNEKSIDAIFESLFKSVFKSLFENIRIWTGISQREYIKFSG